jgi:hypothetical protein
VDLDTDRYTKDGQILTNGIGHVSSRTVASGEQEKLDPQTPHLARRGSRVVGRRLGRHDRANHLRIEPGTPRSLLSHFSWIGDELELPSNRAQPYEGLDRPIERPRHGAKFERSLLDRYPVAPLQPDAPTEARDRIDDQANASFSTGSSFRIAHPSTCSRFLRKARQVIAH